MPDPMLPIKSWTITYTDGSTFDSTQGSWAEAPPFGVFAVVYYHAPAGVTVDRDQDVYEFLGVEVGGRSWKMGLWTDGENYWRLHDVVNRMVTP